MTIDLEATRREAEGKLHARNVFDIDAYGWLGEDDYDPDFYGYAMWVTSPPYEHDLDAWQRNTPPGRSPSEAEQRLIELGHDFFGLMKTARHFIGHALLTQEAVEPFRIEPVEFDFNEFAALAALTAAADRMRDFIIVTILGKKTGEEGQLQESYTRMREAGHGDDADDLARLFRAAGRARKSRNEAVHGLATQPARVQRLLIEQDRTAFLEKGWPKRYGDDLSHADMVTDAASADRSELDALEARAQTLCDCYTDIVKAGEAGLRIEYHWRGLSKA